jgi:hypothetical protein
MCCQRLMKLNQYGQNLVLLEQDVVGVFSTSCLGFLGAKKFRLICTSFCVAAESVQETLPYALIFWGTTVLQPASQSSHIELLVLRCSEYHKKFVKIDKRCKPTWKWPYGGSWVEEGFWSGNVQFFKRQICWGVEPGSRQELQSATFVEACLDSVLVWLDTRGIVLPNHSDVQTLPHKNSSFLFKDLLWVSNVMGKIVGTLRRLF